MTFTVNGVRKAITNSPDDPFTNEAIDFTLGPTAPEPIEAKIDS